VKKFYDWSIFDEASRRTINVPKLWATLYVNYDCVAIAVIVITYEPNSMCVLLLCVQSRKSGQKRGQTIADGLVVCDSRWSAKTREKKRYRRNETAQRKRAATVHTVERGPQIASPPIVDMAELGAQVQVVGARHVATASGQRQFPVASAASKRWRDVT